jgi:WD40 repeat protein
MLLKICIKDHCLSGYPSCCSWSKLDSNFIVLGSETGQLAIYDVRSITQKPMISSQVHNRLIRSVHFSPNLDLIATASEDCKTKLFKVNKTTENSLKEM